MSNTVNLTEFRGRSLKQSLRSFYYTIEKSQIHLEDDRSKRSDFFHKSRNEFIDILRRNKNLSQWSGRQDLNPRPLAPQALAPFYPNSCTENLLIVPAAYTSYNYQ
jgi:hypothetical protein